MDFQADSCQGQVDCPVCGAPSCYDYSGRDLMFDLHERFDYFRCSGCACVFQHPMPDMERIGSFYPENYSVYDQEGRTRKLSELRLALLRNTRGYTHLKVSSFYRVLAAMLGPFRRMNTPAWAGGRRMLDVGCGNGRFLMTMQTLGWDVQGVELSESGMKSCRMSGLQVHHGDLFSAGFPEAFFDLVTVRHVVEHVPDPRALMAELSRILKPGGRLVVETPSSEALGRQWFNKCWYANDIPRHLFLFSAGNLERLGCGFGLSRSSLALDTTPKIFLNSMDYVCGNRGKPSKRIAWKRFLARLYVYFAKRNMREDTMQMTFVKDGG